ncbi:hypothetical protein D3C75_1351800 [compost metagenome]
MSLPLICSVISSLTESMASLRASSHNWAPIAGQASEGKLRRRPGARFQPIMAASTGMVPDPQKGS